MDALGPEDHDSSRLVGLPAFPRSLFSLPLPPLERPLGLSEKRYLLSWPVITTGLWWSRWTPFLSLARGSNNISIMVLLVSLRCVVEPSGRSSPRTAAHAAFNLSLFPPLFFFCALYYTDVPSVLSVVVVYVAFKMERPLLVVPLGLVSLLFRQTNIFWVAVYLGGREVLRQLRRGKERDGFKDDASFLGLAKASWKHGAVYDPLVREAWFEGKGSTCFDKSYCWVNCFRRLLQNHPFHWACRPSSASSSNRPVDAIHLVAGCLWRFRILEPWCRVR